MPVLNSVASESPPVPVIDSPAPDARISDAAPLTTTPREGNEVPWPPNPMITTLPVVPPRTFPPAEITTPAGDAPSVDDPVPRIAIDPLPTDLKDPPAMLTPLPQA